MTFPGEKIPQEALQDSRGQLELFTDGGDPAVSFEKKEAIRYLEDIPDWEKKLHAFELHDYLNFCAFREKGIMLPLYKTIQGKEVSARLWESDFRSALGLEGAIVAAFGSDALNLKDSETGVVGTSAVKQLSATKFVVSVRIPEIGEYADILDSQGKLLPSKQFDNNLAAAA